MAGYDGSQKRGQFARLAAPSLFFLAVIVYQELFLKLYCFRVIPVRGVGYTILFSIPIALALGLLIGCVQPRRGRILLLVITALLCVWMATQTVYYYLFKTFMSLASLLKAGMVAGEFGGLAVINTLKNWFPVLMECLPFLAAFLLRDRLVSEGRAGMDMKIHWATAFVIVQLMATLMVMGSDSGALSLAQIYRQSDSPELVVTNFGVLTEARLEIKRAIFGVNTDEKWPEGDPFPDSSSSVPGGMQPDGSGSVQLPAQDEDEHVLEIDFDSLIAREKDETLLAMHEYFSQVKPTEINQWTGYFEGKNLVWIVAESFSSLAVDPKLTPTLYQLSQEGFVFNNFYTPLWGVSTSDGEYVTTTGLIPKAGSWSYLKSAQNYMPFGFGNMFSRQGYRTLAYHNHTYTYYGREQSYPNMGYEYYGLGSGLNVTPTWPESDVEMMELSVPQYVDEEQFMVYYLTVSGHLNYSPDQNDIAAKHWDAVKDLPYTEGPKGYLATQIELDQAVASLIRQLGLAGRLEDTVIVLSGDHYPYGLEDEEISQLLGHEVDSNFEKYKSNLIIWNSAMEQAVQVDKYSSSLDVMPTLANLFGLEYDSRLIIGRDLLDNEPGLVIFSNYSFLSDKGAYVSVRDTFTPWEGQEADEDYVNTMLEYIRGCFNYSALILDEDYYRILFQPETRTTQ